MYFISFEPKIIFASYRICNCSYKSTNIFVNFSFLPTLTVVEPIKSSSYKLNIQQNLHHHKWKQYNFLLLSYCNWFTNFKTPLFLLLPQHMGMFLFLNPRLLNICSFNFKNELKNSFHSLFSRTFHIFSFSNRTPYLGATNIKTKRRIIRRIGFQKTPSFWGFIRKKKNRGAGH